MLVERLLGIRLGGLRERRWQRTGFEKGRAKNKYVSKDPIEHTGSSPREIEIE